MPKETTGMAALILISQKISKNTVKSLKHTQYTCGTLLESLRLNAVGAFSKKKGKFMEIYPFYYCFMRVQLLYTVCLG